MYNFKDFDSQLASIIDFLLGDMRSIQTGSATPVVLDKVNVEVYGSFMPVAHLASINIEDAKTLRVAPYDKSVMRDLEKAINDADLGLSVASDSDGLRIIFPSLTTERRTQYLKIAKDRLEDARIKIRKVRDEVKREIEDGAKNGEYGEDDKKRYLEQLQAKVDSANQECESVYSSKEKDVMGV